MTVPKNENKSIELVFPRPKRDMDVYLPKVKGEDFFQLFSADIQSISQWFNEYRIDSIGLKIENIINHSKSTKLILGCKDGNGGLAVVLKPNKICGTNGSNNQDFHEVHSDSNEGV